MDETDITLCIDLSIVMRSGSSQEPTLTSNDKITVDYIRFKLMIDLLGTLPVALPVAIRFYECDHPHVLIADAVSMYCPRYKD